MSVKIVQQCNAIESWYEEGKLQFDIGEKHYAIEVNGIKNQVFTKQCKHYVNPEIFAWLTNDEYGLVIWRSGIGMVYTLEGKYFVKSIICSLPSFLGYWVENGGSLEVGDYDSIYPIDRITNGEDAILSTKDFPMSMTYSMKSENVEYTAFTRNAGLGAPVIRYIKKDNIIITLGSGRYESVEKLREGVILKGHLVVNGAFTYAGGGLC